MSLDIRLIPLPMFHQGVSRCHCVQLVLCSLNKQTRRSIVLAEKICAEFATLGNDLNIPSSCCRIAKMVLSSGGKKYLRMYDIIGSIPGYNKLFATRTVNSTDIYLTRERKEKKYSNKLKQPKKDTTLKKIKPLCPLASSQL